jgi:two-component system sensor histidine kinase YesM
MKLRNGLQRIFHRVKLSTRFTLFFFLLVFVPSSVFIGLYSFRLISEREREITYENQLVLKQASWLFSRFIQQARGNYGALNANISLTRLLEGTFLSETDEIFAYNSAVAPALSGIQASNPAVENVFIYYYNKTRVNYSDVTSYLRDVGQFPYDRQTLDKVSEAGVYHHILPHEGGDLSIICLFALYSMDYADVIGILEIQLGLPEIVREMGLNIGEVYVKYGDMCASLNTTGQNAPVSCAELATGLDAQNLLFTDIEESGFELMFLQRANNISAQIIQHILLTAAMLFVPASTLWLYFYSFTRRLIRFSDHISRTGEVGLTSYVHDTHSDEFGVVVSEYNKMAETMDSLIQSIRHAEKLKNAANYYAMVSQVNPHFLFNTLENVRMHIELEQYATASDMLFILSHFFRYNISMRQESSLKDELEHIRHYLLIYQYRRNHQITFAIQTDPELTKITCPFCLLQPIVENCLKHGIATLREKLVIHITVTDTGNGVEVSVSDNGAGMSAEQIEAINQKLKEPLPEDEISNEHVGVANVNSRLRYYYGQDCGVTFRANVPNGLTCLLLLGYTPARRP